MIAETAADPRDAHRYFADLDGLRAVAVVPVVLYHAGVSWIPGGFVGVDIFFVLSGFFITRQLAADLDSGRYSLLKFYERRARRILPALFAMLTMTSVLAAYLLTPPDLMSYAKSLLSTLAFGSNFHFWLTSNYFDTAAELKPLLHTWSLAVEEQFYIFLPPVLWAIWRFGRGVTIAFLAIAALLSFVLCVVGSSIAPTASFYLGPTRAWELLIGSLIALSPVPRLSKVVRDLLSCIALAMLAGSLTLITHATAFPGWAAAFPTVGAGLVVIVSLAGGGIGNRLLAIRPMVYIGLISYSLYLWHWPLLALAHNVAFQKLGVVETWGLVALGVILATLSWRYVERPFRGARSSVSVPALVGFSAAGFAAICAAGAILIASGGLPQRLKPEALAFLENEFVPVPSACFSRTADDVAAGRLCAIGARDAAARMVIWGDSHASRVAINMHTIGEKLGVATWYAAKGACPPLLGASWAGDRLGCSAFNDAVAKRLHSDPAEIVVLGGLWANYTEGVLTTATHIFKALSDDGTSSTNAAGNREVFARSLLRTVRTMRVMGKKVLIVGPFPELDWPAPQRLATAARFGQPMPSGPSLERFLERQKTVLAVLAQMERIEGVVVVYPHKVMCDAQACAVTHNGKRLYFDDNHIDMEGNRLIEPMIKDALTGLLGASVRSGPVTGTLRQ